ncbi:MAG TPA: proteobacterial dedicated sortase system histidine kinase, partial [Pseudomonadaceae bacterium]|nr:proteobacterial dedicated sortase system histidine kinase [Pseudomonadaceae bacterium]
ALYDVDDTESRRLESIVASSGIHEADTLGRLQRPEPEIDRIVAGMGQTNSLVRVIDRTQRVLLSNGSIETANGLMLVDPESTEPGPWAWLRNNFLHALYEKILTQPTHEYMDELYESGSVEGELAVSALTGLPRVGFHVLAAPETQGSTRLLQAAWPITVGTDILGAVVVSQNMNGINTFRNQALQLLFDIMLGIILVTVLGLFLFASKLSSRILSLRDQAERIIDEKGRFTNTIVPSRTPDEIGDLSRSFANIVERLGQYTHYLENMSSRLSHELRTPVTVVRSSLENLSLVSEDQEAKVYIQRAEEGISRLNLILNKMSEAARLEQILQDSDKEPMELNQVVAACMDEYRQIYPHLRFETTISRRPVMVFGTAEYIAQLMDKIISNAVDFADPEHPVRVNCNEDTGEAAISVSNHGPCLDLHMKDRIFDSMVSVRSQSRKKLPHLGMGLHIARMITEYHGGYIYADNLLGGDGVIVVVRLPLYKP